MLFWFFSSLLAISVSSVSTDDTICTRTYSDLITSNSNGQYEFTTCFYFDATLNISEQTSRIHFSRNVAVLNNGYTVLLEEDEGNSTNIWVNIFNSNGNLIVNRQKLLYFDNYPFSTVAIVTPHNIYDNQFVVIFKKAINRDYNEVKYKVYNADTLSQQTTTVSDDGNSFTPNISEASDLLMDTFDSPAITSISNNNYALIYRTSNSRMYLNVFNNQFNVLYPSGSYQVTKAYNADDLEDLSIKCHNTEQYTDICFCVFALKKTDTSSDREARYNLLKIVYNPDKNTVGITDITNINNPDSDHEYQVNEISDRLIWSTNVYALSNNNFLIWWMGSTKNDGWKDYTYVKIYDIDGNVVMNQTLVNADGFYEGFQITDSGIIVGATMNDIHTTGQILHNTFGFVWDNDWNYLLNGVDNSNNYLDGAILFNNYEVFTNFYNGDLWDTLTFPEIYIEQSGTNDFIVILQMVRYIGGVQYVSYFGGKISVYNECCNNDDTNNDGTTKTTTTTTAATTSTTTATSAIIDVSGSMTTKLNDGVDPTQTDIAMQLSFRIMHLLVLIWIFCN